MTTLAPRTADEVTDAIRWALAAGEALDVASSGTRRAFGRPVQAPHVLDVSALSGIVSYEPAELILTALPGTPMDTLEAALAEHSQCMAFEPPNLAPLLAGSALSGTLGGVVATGLSGPRRLKAGAVRDHVLGIGAVSGRAERFVGGGKVVKNVTGYDIPKLMTGSHGTLAVLTEITLKVLPAPEDVRTLVVLGLSAQDAVRAMTGVLQSAMDASGACHVPASLTAGLSKSLTSAAASSDKFSEGSVTAFRLEGFRPSVDFRLTRLREQLAREGSLAVLELEASLAFWRGVRDVAPLADDPSRIVWRLSVPPARAAAVLERIERAIPGAQAILDWGGGLIWLQLPANTSQTPVEAAPAGTAHAHAHAVRAAIGHGGGHATLIRASADVRASVEVFHPQPTALASLSKRVKAQFDPSGVLNPGRMYAGV